MGKTLRWGKRQEKYFSTLPESRNWLEDAKYAHKQACFAAPSAFTVDAWA